MIPTLTGGFVTTGVAQGPVVGHLLFNIFVEESEVTRVHSHLQRTPNWEDQSITLEDKVAFRRDLTSCRESQEAGALSL